MHKIYILQDNHVNCWSSLDCTLYTVPLCEGRIYTTWPSNKAPNKPINANAQTRSQLFKTQLNPQSTETKQPPSPPTAKYLVQRALRWDPRGGIL